MIELLSLRHAKKKSHWNLDRVDIATQFKYAFLLRTDGCGPGKHMSQTDKIYLPF